jgi:peptidoglycan/LPS O-acetylase OafA/YrhL
MPDRAWVGWIWRHGRNLWRSFPVAAIATAAFVAAFTNFGDSIGHRVRFIMGIPYAAILILVLWAEDRPAGVPRISLPLFSGNTSYAIYLVQFPVQIILERAGVARGLPVRHRYDLFCVPGRRGAAPARRSTDDAVLA